MPHLPEKGLKSTAEHLQAIKSRKAGVFSQNSHFHWSSADERHCVGKSTTFCFTIIVSWMKSVWLKAPVLQLFYAYYYSASDFSLSQLSFPIYLFNFIYVHKTHTRKHVYMCIYIYFFFFVLPHRMGIVKTRKVVCMKVLNDANFENFVTYSNFYILKNVYIFTSAVLCKLI